MSTGEPLFDDQGRYVDRFGALLLVTTLAVVTLSLVDLRASTTDLRGEIGEITVSVFVGATLLLALRASGVGRRFRLIADIAVIAGIVATVLLAVLTDLDGIANPRNGGGSPSMVWVFLSLVAPVVVVRRLVKHDRASGKTLLGAVSAYLLIALAFNFAFLMVDVFGEGAFFGDEEPSTSFMYYSLVTITTLGYGDLAAASTFGRLLSTVEALVGQVYLVTFVGMIVGLLVSNREARAA